MSETYPNKGTRETLFAGHTPSSVGFDCKITNYFSFLQIKKPLMSKNINGNVKKNRHLCLLFGHKWRFYY